MFTGIITDIGVIEAMEDHGDRQFAIRCGYEAATIDLGASIACSGVCLTVTKIDPTADGALFFVDASGETLSVTTAGAWQVGTRLNLERALSIGDELGGTLFPDMWTALAALLIFSQMERARNSRSRRLKILRLLSPPRAP